MLATVQRLVRFAVIGAVLADVVTLSFAPSILQWFQTPALGGALCNCIDLTRETAESLVRAQLVGAVVGATLAVVVGELAWRAWRQKRSREAIALVSASSGKTG